MYGRMQTVQIFIINIVQNKTSLRLFFLNYIIIVIDLVNAGG